MKECPESNIVAARWTTTGRAPLILGCKRCPQRNTSQNGDTSLVLRYTQEHMIRCTNSRWHYYWLAVSTRPLPAQGNFSQLQRSSNKPLKICKRFPDISRNLLFLNIFVLPNVEFGAVQKCANLANLVNRAGAAPARRRVQHGEGGPPSGLELSKF